MSPADGGHAPRARSGPAAPGPSRRGGPRRASAGARPARSSDPARDTAYAVLTAVRERDAYANLVLPALLRERRLDPRDAALATELAYGTLRGLGTYDAVLAACADRPLGRVDPPVLDALRMGAHQLLSTRVPPHAAVSATVDLVRKGPSRGAAGFANAVLRRVTTRDRDAWLAELAPPLDEDPVGHLALAHAHPRWVVRALRDALDGSMEETAAALEADNVRPAVTLAVRPGRADVEELIAEGASPGSWSPYAAVLAGGDPGDLPEVRAGQAGVQDEGSQLVALAVAGAPLDGPDVAWLDGCAGPGGKAALLAGLAAGRGARVLAAELAPHRARLVAQAAVPTGAAAVVVADSTAPPWRAGVFDRVVVDVPCSGLGALRRRPEARWRRKPEDVVRLGPLQRALLRSALASARPGGVVAYATCSPHRAETRDVVDDVLAGRDDVERIDARRVLDAVTARPLPALGEGPDVQLWPHRHGTDAMYLALLRRR
ncbi:RsmB/NOP family class I SAM-dependent RNA methyltransferase [Motilibacter aurantiacus]|uniref:RsmB/NOP family class I SAM-dependent RNA methyltransferase n=1 Tax=Motilibacter aurantiacus TaxID=2714955 RepID=UPI00140C1474|nr:rRNA cytosine-C5-methyltransferase [Motilibacter aurantiacus]